MVTDQPPVVLCFGGTDPTAGAGVAADVLTLASLGCHPAIVVTAVTAQDTSGVKQYSAVPPELVIAQARAVLEDMAVTAFKTGMLCNSAIVSAVASIVDDYPQIPLIVDPVQASGHNDPLSEEPLDDALRVLLLPRALLVTPNSEEARRLAPGADTLDACAQELLSLGCEYVLITGTASTPTNACSTYLLSSAFRTLTTARVAHSLPPARARSLTVWIRRTPSRRPCITPGTR
jgi:hydroxymethylpyrimidine/phosphomethylpyrimidine kinase